MRSHRLLALAVRTWQQHVVDEWELCGGAPYQTPELLIAKCTVWSTMMLAVHAQRHVLFSEGMWLRSELFMQSQRLVLDHCVQRAQGSAAATSGGTGLPVART